MTSFQINYFDFCCISVSAKTLYVAARLYYNHHASPVTNKIIWFPKRILHNIYVKAMWQIIISSFLGLVSVSHTPMILCSFVLKIDLHHVNLVEHHENMLIVASMFFVYVNMDLNIYYGRNFMALSLLLICLTSTIHVIVLLLHFNIHIWCTCIFMSFMCFTVHIHFT